MLTQQHMIAVNSITLSSTSTGAEMATAITVDCGSGVDPGELVSSFCGSPSMLTASENNNYDMLVNF